MGESDNRKDEAEENDLRTSIESIDRRLNVLIGQTNQVFKNRVDTNSSSPSPQRDLQMQPTAATSQAGAITVMTTINSQSVKG